MSTKQDNLTVLVSLKETDKKLVSFAASFAEKLGSSIRLVHNLEIPMPPYTTNYLAEEQKLIHEAETRLQQLKEIAENQVSTTIQVVKGSIPHSLVFDAVTHHSSYLLCSSLFNSRFFFPERISTTVKILKESPIPVINVGYKSDIDLSAEQNITIFDDFSITSQVAIQKIRELTRCLSAKTKQIHITNYDELIDLEEILDDKMDMAALSIDQFEKHRQLHETVYQSLFLLRDESDQLNALPEVKEGWDYLIHIGKPSKEIGRIKAKTNPDMVVFGRHHIFDTHEFKLGQVDYGRMLDESRVTIIS